MPTYQKYANRLSSARDIIDQIIRELEELEKEDLEDLANDLGEVSAELLNLEKALEAID